VDTVMNLRFLKADGRTACQEQMCSVELIKRAGVFWRFIVSVATWNIATYFLL
jgi:hypothetical protein